MIASPAAAQDSASLESLRQQLQALKAEQANMASKIDAIESVLNRIEGKAPAPAVSSKPVASAAATEVTAVPLPEQKAAPKLALNGDVRLRFETNKGDKDARDRNRGVFRARLRATYAINSWLTAGGQITTGDPDDPNSTDITMSNFDDRFQVSLDQAYLRATHGNLTIWGGRVPQPFVRTELVWDGDVSPQGLSASYKLPFGNGSALKSTAIYMPVDESIGGSDSQMIGGQFGVEFIPTAAWKVELYAAYYNYTLKSLGGGDTGDFRSNLFVLPGGTVTVGCSLAPATNCRYLSDYDLVDAIGALTYQGIGPKWPIRVVADYVKNTGAATNEDTGFGVDIYAGRGTKKGDWRFGYGYAQAETDAVLAAFSHDNTNIATNYMQHTLLLDYALTDNIVLNATWYHYKPLHSLHSGSNELEDWLDRIRFNFLASF